MKRYRVVGREAVHFADGTTVNYGYLVPKDVDVPQWVVDVGWVKEEK